MPEESVSPSPDSAAPNSPGGPRPQAPVAQTPVAQTPAAQTPAPAQAPARPAPPVASTPTPRAANAPVAARPNPAQAAGAAGAVGAAGAAGTAYVQGAVAKESLKPSPPPNPGVDLRWVWTEVRKRVFIKVPFSRQVADIMEAATPITLDEDHFVVGLPPNKFPLSSFLTADQVKNTIEAILQQAAGRRIRFEVIEGSSPEDWQIIKQRRERAQEAVVAMAQQNSQIHHYEDVLNQIAGEIRGRVTATRDRNFPQVRAQLLLHFVPIISDASDMLFPDPEAHEARRILARTIDRIAGFLEVPAMTLAIEIERYRLEHVSKPKQSHNAMPRPIASPSAHTEAQPAPRPAPATPAASTAPAASAAPAAPAPANVPQPAPANPATDVSTQNVGAPEAKNDAAEAAEEPKPEADQPPAVDAGEGPRDT